MILSSLKTGVSLWVQHYTGATEGFGVTSEEMETITFCYSPEREIFF